MALQHMVREPQVPLIPQFHRRVRARRDEQPREMRVVPHHVAILPVNARSTHQTEKPWKQGSGIRLSEIVETEKPVVPDRGEHVTLHRMPVHILDGRFPRDSPR